MISAKICAEKKKINIFVSTLMALCSDSQQGENPALDSKWAEKVYMPMAKRSVCYECTALCVSAKKPSKSQILST